MRKKRKKKMKKKRRKRESKKKKTCVDCGRDGTGHICSPKLCYCDDGEGELTLTEIRG
jgi:hypothetical protein